jgi:hypothetical protein
VTETWLLDETRTLTSVEASESTRRSLGFEDPGSRSPLAVVVKDVIIHDVKRWFGAGDVRLDTLLVTANPAERIYEPSTFSFPGVRDGAKLPIDDHGMAIYFGRPRHVLDVSIIASAGESTQTLGELLATSAEHLGDLLAQVATLAAPFAPGSAVLGAAAAAATLSGTVLRLLGEITGKSIGLYRVTWFEQRDQLGIGVHPNDGTSFRMNDFEFRYEIFEEKPPST